MAEGTWIDAFVTKPLKDEADAVFMGSVMSVKPARGPFEEVDFGGGRHLPGAYPYDDFNQLNIVKESSTWVSPRWLAGENNAYSGDEKFKDFLNMKTGDLIYIGHNLGATTVRTILERKTFRVLVNRTGESYKMATEHTNTPDLLLNCGVGGSTAANPPGVGSYMLGEFVAYRLDVPVTATETPDAGGNYTAVEDHNNTPVTLSTHHNFTFPDDSMQNPDRPDSKYWCPLYKLNNVHLNSRLILPLDHGVKALHCVKLVAYSSNNKSLPGYLHFHEFAHDDYVMLGIKELPASLLSNEATSRGAFAALHISDTGETYEREPTGIATQYVNPGASNVRQLTLELTNRKGEPAHLGRLHLWFKLLVTHG